MPPSGIGKLGCGELERGKILAASQPARNEA